jgi:secreted trypsin-like serine protease
LTEVIVKHVLGAIAMLIALSGAGEANARTSSAQAITDLAIEGRNAEAHAALVQVMRNRKLNADEIKLVEDVAVATKVDDAIEAGLIGNRIVHAGGAVAEGEIPGVVALQVFQPFKKTWITYCAGTLISAQRVLTAGHCIDYGENYVRVAYGSVDLDGPRVATASIAQLVRHPAYAVQSVTHSSGVTFNAANHDYGLVYLKQPLPMAPVVLASSPDKASVLAYGSLARVVGWGMTEKGTPSSVLLYADVPVVTDSVCAQSYSRLDNSTTFCAGYALGGADSCKGDSGGPIFGVVNGTIVQIGVVSFGYGCGASNAYGVYAWIGAVLPWIADSPMGSRSKRT